jgi:hypothetical protein
VVSHHAVARETAESGLMRAVTVLAVIMPAIALVQVAANSRDYRAPAVALGTWLAVLGATAWLLPRLRRGGLTAAETAAAIAIAAAAVVAVGLAHRPHGAPSSVDLGILGTVGLLIFVVMSCPARVWIPGALVVFAAHSATVIGEGGLNPLNLSKLEAGGYIMAVALLAFSAVRPAVATSARIAARQAALASKSAAERAGMTAIQQERQYRLAVLEREALPLLRGIADGTLDPASDWVRQQGARHAATLRDSLTRRAAGPGGLMTVVEPVLRAARERGLLVTEQFIGDPGIPPPAVVPAVRSMLDAVIGELPPQQVILTVLAPGTAGTAGEPGTDVEVYLTFAASPRRIPELTRFQPDLPATHWHAALVAGRAGDEDSGGCLEVRWRKDRALDSGH